MSDTNGRRLSIAWRLAHVRDVGQRIERAVVANQLSSMGEAHERGETLSVWQPSASSAWLEIRTGAVPNVAIFEAIVGKHVRIAR